MVNAIAMIFGVVFGLIFLGALVAGGYFGFQWLLDLFGTLEPQVASITMIASMVAVLCATIVASGFKWMGRKEKEVVVQADKANLYESILLMWGEKLKQGTKAIESSLDEELQKQERLLTLRGSANVMKAYLALQRQVNTVGLRNPELTSSMAKLILEMRKDLGVSVLNVKESDLVAILQGGDIEEQPSAIMQAGRPPVSIGQGI